MPRGGSLGFRINYGWTLIAMLLVIVLSISPALSAPQAIDALEACILEQARKAKDSTTIGELKRFCHTDTGPLPEQNWAAAELSGTDYEIGALRQRIDAEASLERTSFVITPHAPNFVSYSTVADANQAPYAPLVGADSPVEEQEAVFQVSFKAPIATNLFGTDLAAYFAYTSKSWWQVANDDFSSPFRETNYQPELFLGSKHRHDLGAVSIEGWSLGYAHESNGREQALSRSWDRLEARFGLQVTPDVSLLSRMWYRLPEDEEDDQNPGIYKYRGYGDVRAVWTPNRSTFTAMLNPGTEGTNFELTWSYPINRVFRLYAAYFDGYGESLIDYDFEIQRFSLGVSLNDYVTRY